MKQTAVIILLHTIALHIMSAQDVKNIFGLYTVNAECYITQMNDMEDYIEKHTYDINIEKNDKDDSDIKFFLPEHSINSYIKCLTTIDNKFDIISQKITTQQYYDVHIRGNGTIVGDSVFMNYIISSANVQGILNCDCKGIRATDTVPQSKNEYLIYTYEQTVVIETDCNKVNELSIYNSSGNIVMSTEFYKAITLDKAIFAAGVYVFRISNSDETITRKTAIK